MKGEEIQVVVLRAVKHIGVEVKMGEKTVLYIRSIPYIPRLYRPGVGGFYQKISNVFD